MLGFFRRNQHPESIARPAVKIGLDLARMPGAVQVIDGYPRVHWTRVRQILATCHLTAPPHDVWTEMARQWLVMLGEKLGPEFQVYQGPSLLLLGGRGEGAAGRTLQFAEQTYQKLQGLLGRLKEETGLGKHVLILLNSHASYYEYISIFYPEGDQEQAMSTGMHIAHGYRHTVIDATSRSSQVLRTIAHELAHDMVWSRPLPLWLNEGLAQWAEDLAGDGQGMLIDARLVRLHQRYWGWYGMKHFWDGRGFRGVASQQLSYQLANVLFRNLATDPARRKRLHDFLAAADQKDAGSSACLTCFGCTLGDLVAEFLGPGDWQPISETMANHERRE